VSSCAIFVSADGDVRPCDLDLKKLDIEILSTNSSSASESPYN
jgi:hypothetical protein